MEKYTDTGSFASMMPIDTLSIAKILEAAGTPKKQAEAHARMWGEFNTHNLSTKADIAKVEEKIIQTESRLEEKIIQTGTRLEEKIIQAESRLEEKIEYLRKDTFIEIARIKIDILKWLVPLIITHFGATLAAVTWLLKTVR